MSTTEHIKVKLLIGLTGSIAAIKILELIDLFRDHFDIKIIISHNAMKFIHQEMRNQVRSRGIQIYQDEDEYRLWKKRGDPVLHIQLRKWADAMIIAPLSANTLAKLSTGICDNLITLVCRCWDMKTQVISYQLQEHYLQKGIENKLNKPLIVCPAMNTMMWDHPITSEQLSKLKTWGYTIIDPIQKVLMCGQHGKGAMCDLATIEQTLKRQLARSIQNSKQKAVKE